MSTMHTPGSGRVDQRRTDTREQIQAVALELFAEKGYDGTSLREISERLGITKAAVYYHFRSKEEILASLVEDFLAQLDALLRWAQDQPRDAAFYTEALCRYNELLSGHAAELARFMHEGLSAIGDLALGMNLRARLVDFVELLTAPGDRLTGRLRARAALLSLHLGTLPDPDCDATEAQRRAAALAIATEILSPPYQTAVKSTTRHSKPTGGSP